MRWKSLTVLATLFVGLATFYYIYEIRQGPAREKAEADKGRLWKALEPKDIVELTLTRGAETVQLKRGPEGWQLTAPVQAKAAGRAVEDLLAALATVRVEREIDPNPGKPEEFGLAPPVVEIRFKAKEQEHRVRLGGKNPTGIWVYAQQVDKPAVFLISDSLLRDAQKHVADFRDRTVLAFEPKDVRALEIQPSAAPALGATLEGPGQWRMTAPLTVAADTDQVVALLEAVKGATIKEFVAEQPQALDRYGLEKPTRLVLWLGEEQTRVAKTLRLGSPVPDKQAAYAQREGESTVFLVEDTLLRAVPMSAAALRDKRVLAYDRSRLTRVELESPKGKVALALEGSTWRITAPTSLPADETALGRMLSQIADLRATEFVAESAPGLAPYGLDRPQVRVTVWEREREEASTAVPAAGAGTAPPAGPQEPGKAATKESSGPGSTAPGDQAAATGRESAKGGAPRTLLITPAKDPALAYATIAASGAGAAAGTGAGSGGRGGPVVLVERKILEALSLSAQDLRERSLFAAFEVRDVAKAEIRQDDLTLVLERAAGDDWRLVAPRKGKARSEPVSELLWTLRGLKWRELVAEQGWDPVRYGLAPPATALTLYDKGGKILAALAVGKREKGEAYVRVPGQDPLYLIESRGLGRIPASAEELLL